MLRKRRWITCLLLATWIASGCGSTTSTNADDYVGEYVYQPHDSAPEKFADFLILKRDSTALEFRFSKSTGQVTTTQTKWNLSYKTGEFLNIGDFSHPIEGSRLKIKLGINDDLGQYYEKVR